MQEMQKGQAAQAQDVVEISQDRGGGAEHLRRGCVGDDERRRFVKPDDADFSASLAPSSSLQKSEVDVSVEETECPETEDDETDDGSEDSQVRMALLKSKLVWPTDG